MYDPRKEEYVLKNIKHSCGHIEDEVKVLTQHLYEPTVRKWKEKEPCQDCKEASIKKVRQQEEYAEQVTQTYLEKHGIENAEISTYNNGEAVEIIIHLKVASREKV